MNIPSSFFEYLNVDVELNVKFKFTFYIQFKSVTSDWRYTKFYALSENEKKELKFILVKFVEEIFIKIYVPC
jgi:hypothetical protein